MLLVSRTVNEQHTDSTGLHKAFGEREAQALTGAGHDADPVLEVKVGEPLVPDRLVFTGRDPVGWVFPRFGGRRCRSLPLPIFHRSGLLRQAYHRLHAAALRWGAGTERSGRPATTDHMRQSRAMT